jgi:hypothetical protein
VTVTKVVIFPDDWNRLNKAERNEYTASAAAHGIALTLSPGKSINPDHLIAVRSEGDDSPFAAPFYLGPVRCARARWEHNLRELLDMDDPCFPNPFRDDPGSIRSL